MQRLHYSQSTTAAYSGIPLRPEPWGIPPAGSDSLLFSPRGPRQDQPSLRDEAGMNGIQDRNKLGPGRTGFATVFFFKETCILTPNTREAIWFTAYYTTSARRYYLFFPRKDHHFSTSLQPSNPKPACLCLGMDREEHSRFTDFSATTDWQLVSLNFTSQRPTSRSSEYSQSQNRIAWFLANCSLESFFSRRGHLAWSPIP